MNKPPKPYQKKISPLPIPEAPRRSLTPPAQRAIKDQFTFESKTPTKNETLLKYAALLSVYDELTEEQRIDFVEFCFLFKAMKEDDRKEILEWAIERVFGEIK